MQQNQSVSAAEPEAPGIGEYLAILKKRRRLALAVALPIVALALMFAVGLPDKYRATGVLEIVGARNLQNVLERDPDEPSYADQYVQSLSTIVLSDASLTRLLEAHRLYPNQDADPATVLKEMRRNIGVDIVTVPILDPNTGREREIVTAFSVSFDHPHPERARDGAQWLVDAFLEENRRDRGGRATNAAQFFGAEAERMRERINEFEARLAAFKRKHAGRLPEMNEVNLAAMDRTERDLQSVETQMQALRRERVFLTAQLQQARSMGPETASLRQLEEEYRLKGLQYDESHPDLVSLRRQIEVLKRGGSTTGMSLQAQLQTQRSILEETRQRYSEDHPDVRRIVRNIEALEARIAAGDEAERSIAADSPMAMQIQTQLNATDTQLAALTARAAELRTQLVDLQGRLSSAPEVEREYQAVTRDLTSARAKYEELLRRQMDAEVSQAAITGGTADEFRVTSTPGVPQAPAQPKRLALALIGLVLGCIAAVSAILVAQLLDSTVRGARDIRELLDVTPLSTVPVIENSDSIRLRRKQTWSYAAKAAVVVVAVYYAATQLIF